MKLEQASKVKLRMPTPLRLGEGRAGREETDKHLHRSVGVVSTACSEGDLGNRGRPAAGGVRNFNAAEKGSDQGGIRKGSRYRRSRVTPVEGRTLTSGVLLKKER